MNIELEIHKQLNLPRKEAKVYLKLLGLGESTAFQIASACAIPRATVYTILSSLEHRELVSSWKKNNVTYYEAHHPNTFLRILNEQLLNAQTLVPQLAILVQEHSSRPTVKFHTGRVGVKRALDNLYAGAEKRRVKQFYTFSHPELAEYFPKYLTNLLIRKKKLGIKTNLIVPHNIRGKSYSQYKNDEQREIRFFPANYDFFCTLVISDTEVLLISLHEKELHAVQIFSQSISTMFKQIFRFIWDNLLPS